MAIWGGESETFCIQEELLAELHENTVTIDYIENELYTQRKQRPYNLPYINMLEQARKDILINQQHIKDHLDKLDGCF